MTTEMESWFVKRENLAEAFGVTPQEVPAEAVWFLSWPPKPLTERDIRRTREIADKIKAVDFR